MPGRRKNPERYRSLAHYFGARIRDLRDSYEHRTGRRLSLNELAARTGYSRSMISAIERGDHLPENGDRVRLIDQTLNANGELTCMWPLVQRLGRRPIDELIAAADSGNNNSVIPQGQDDDMQRRLLFRLTGLGLIAGPAFNDAEALRQLVEKAIGTAESSHVEDWEAVGRAHRHALATRPPAEVRDGLTADLAALQWSLAQAKPEHKADLQRSMAYMSVLYANALTRLGQYAAARRWWTTARRAADASGDLETRVRVRGNEAIYGLYDHRSPESVISLSRESQRMAGDMVSIGVLQTLAAEAQALAVMGRDHEARQRLNRLYAVADKIGERDDGLGWTPDSLWFVASWVHSYGGAARAADEAREEASRRLPAYQNASNLRLHQAIALARNGGHQEALRLATETISGLAPAYRSQVIMHTARQVQELVPPDQRKGSAFDDYRAAVLGSSSSL